MMKAKEKQRRKLDTSKKNRVAESSSDGDEDSDAERNFALLAKKRGANEDDNEDVEGSETGEDDADEEEDVEEKEEAEEEGDSEASASEEDEDSEDDVEDDDDEEEEEAAGGSGEIQTREDVKKELSNMSFEDVLKLQNQVGTKVYNQVAYGGDGGIGGGSISTAKRRKPRQNKNRPMEMSAKRPVSVLRQVVTAKKPMFRDPRFDDLSGEYKPEIFEKTYKFIDDIRSREKQLVQKKLRKLKTNCPRKEELSFLLKRMENQERAKKNREEQRERELQFKRQQRERANHGEAPFFLKKSDKRKLQLAQKYEELKKSGKLDNFLSKKRKRNAGKDRRKLPRADKTAA